MAGSKMEMHAQNSWNRAAARGSGLCDFRRVPHEDMHGHMSLLLNSLAWIRVTFGRPGDHHSLATSGTVCTLPVSDKLGHLCLCVNISSAARFGFICNPELSLEILEIELYILEVFSLKLKARFDCLPSSWCVYLKKGRLGFGIGLYNPGYPI